MTIRGSRCRRQTILDDARCQWCCAVPNQPNIASTAVCGGGTAEQADERKLHRADPASGFRTSIRSVRLQPGRPTRDRTTSGYAPETLLQYSAVKSAVPQFAASNSTMSLSRCCSAGPCPPCRKPSRSGCWHHCSFPPVKRAGRTCLHLPRTSLRPRCPCPPLPRLPSRRPPPWPSRYQPTRLPIPQLQPLQPPWKETRTVRQPIRSPTCGKAPVPVSQGPGGWKRTRP